jgi:hypothetical protein
MSATKDPFASLRQTPGQNQQDQDKGKGQAAADDLDWDAVELDQLVSLSERESGTQTPGETGHPPVAGERQTPDLGRAAMDSRARHDRDTGRGDGFAILAAERAVEPEVELELQEPLPHERALAQPRLPVRRSSLEYWGRDLGPVSSGEAAEIDPVQGVPTEPEYQIGVAGVGATNLPSAGEHAQEPSLPPPLATGFLRAARSARRDSVFDSHLPRAFAGRPRLRIVCGFALALVLGGIVPLTYGSSVNRQQVEPLRQALARSVAYGKLAAHEPKIREPEHLRAEIRSIRWRSALLVSIVWCVISAVLCLIWFRLL